MELQGQKDGPGCVNTDEAISGQVTHIFVEENGSFSADHLGKVFAGRNARTVESSC
jgi:hypothetical protein